MTDSAPTHYFTRQSVSAPKNPPQPMPLRVGPLALQMATGRGVFAKAGLDAGSRLLLETALPATQALPPDSRICDLGCGWGALGCFLAARHSSTLVYLCDINARAAWLARYNAAHNNLPNVQVWCGDGLKAAGDNSFHQIVCNPPIRAGNATMETLFQDAHRCLQPQGQFWAVIRTAQGAKSWQKRLEKLFGNCETVVIVSGYRILQCTKTGP